MRLSQDGDPCPAKANFVPDGCEGYTTTPAMQAKQDAVSADQRTGTKLPVATIVGVVAGFAAIMFIFSKRRG